MKHIRISDNGSRRLILLFAGWGMDAAPFAGLHRHGYDIELVWDYTDFGIDWSFTAGYDEICIVAWSYGVYAASVSTESLESRVTLRLAVSGTLHPCHRRLGIPENIFRGTLAAIDPHNMRKFYRRICADRREYARISASLPQRDTDSLRRELESFSPENLWLHHPYARYDFALIGRDDAIIPPANQWRAWQGVPCHVYDGGHMPDFEAILQHYIMDKDLVGSRFRRGFAAYDSAGDIQRRVAGVLSDMLRRHTSLSRPGQRTLEIGSGTGLLTAHLDAAVGPGYLEMWDLAGDSPLPVSATRRFRRGDAETDIRRLPSGSFDAIVSASTVQWFNSPLRFVDECLRVLRPGGVLAISTFTAGNLEEINAVTGRSLPLLTRQQWHEAIRRKDQGGIIDSYGESIDKVFDSAADVFRHLKATGVNALGRTGDVPLRKVLENYRPHLDGRWHITYKPFSFITRRQS